MSVPATVGDALNELNDYHRARGRRYDELLQKSDDARTTVLLEELVRLENESAQILSDEKQGLGRGDQTRLLPGTGMLHRETHASHCQCESTPSFDDTVACALARNTSVDELINRIEGATAAQSIRELAGRLRELETIKARQIAKYLRED